MNVSRLARISLIPCLVVGFGAARDKPKPHLGSGIREAEAEARAILPACPPSQPDSGLRHQCLFNQKMFVGEFVRALAGSRDAMDNLAFSYSPAAQEPTVPTAAPDVPTGLPLMPVEACAWRLVLIELPGVTKGVNDEVEEHTACDHLTNHDLNSAKKRAQALERDLAQGMTAMPPEDWQPSGFEE